MLQCDNCNRGGFLVAALALAMATPVPAQASEAAPWRAVDASTGQIDSVADLTGLVVDFPDSASVRLRLVNALMNAGEEEAAAKEALQLALRGYAFSENAEAVLSDPLDPDYAAWFHAATRANRAPLVASTVLTALPAEAQLVESVARDPKTGDLYATTVVSRALYVKRGEGAWQRLDLPDAGSLSGIAYDAKSRLLWIASGNFEETPGARVNAALLGFDPETGQVARTLYTGGAGALGDVAVGDDGTVYAADPTEGVIYRAAPDEPALSVLVGAGTFRSPQGMVAAPGKPLLVVSDYRYGLAAVDTRTGQVRRIASARPALLDGIDGLWRSGKSLIAVQNGASPARIVRLTMSADWLEVSGVGVLEQANPAWTEPLGGTVSGDELVYVATGQWDAFGPGGALREGRAASPTEVRLLPLHD